MESLRKRFGIKLSSLKHDFRRYLHDEIDWSNRLIAIKGARGAGKTTMLLQHVKENLEINEKTLYASLDDIYFQANTLVDLADEFYRNGGLHLILDEVHKYPNWSIEIKTIYDTYLDLQIIFTSSSVLEIHKGEADLSRRAVVYTLEGLSFREFVNLETKKDFESLKLEDILQNHMAIAYEMTQDLKIFPLFTKYLQIGYYPFYREGESSYTTKLNSVINLTLETDIPSVFHTEYKTIYKLKKLLYIISTSLPYQPNITELSKSIETSSRTSTLQYLDYLEKAKLIANLKTGAKGKNIMVKPDKVYLENTNLMNVIGNFDVNNGNVRETFFFNQIKTKHKVNTSKIGDFFVNDKYIFEVGGKGKKTTQIKGELNSFIASDNLDVGLGNKIPLWLFGFLY